jgi:hypothetical protein
MHVLHVHTGLFMHSYYFLASRESNVALDLHVLRTNCTYICYFFYIAPVPYLRLSFDMLQARQYIILSITVSHRNHDIDPNFLPAVLSVLVRYTTGVFSDTTNAVTSGSPTRL